MSPTKCPPTGLKLVVVEEGKRHWEFIKERCPDGGIISPDGVVRPKDRGFCEDSRKYSWERPKNCLLPYLVVGKVPGPYVNSKHPVSCGCICAAINHEALYRIKRHKFEVPRKLPIPRTGGKTEEQSDWIIDVFVGNPRVDGYSGEGDPDFGKPGFVAGPPFIILGHELCGHGIVRDWSDGDGAVVVENEIRKEHGVPGRRDGKNHW